MIGFEAKASPRIVYGVDAVDEIGSMVKSIGAGRVLLVTDPGIVSAGHMDRVAKRLRQSNIDFCAFTDVAENPSTKEVERCLETARAAEVDLIIGLGGGSSLDTAKGCNLILSNGGKIEDYKGYGKASKPMLPFIAIPTTTGTGSECQSYALIATEDSHEKMACGDPKAMAKIAILDPSLAKSQPRFVIACTGCDAMAHAIESAVSLNHNELSLLYSREAFRLINANLEIVLASSGIEALGAMLLGSAYAGLAIENSMLGGAHSAANPLTAKYNVVHGNAVGMMLPHVMRYNAGEVSAASNYALLATTVGIATNTDTQKKACERLISRVEDLLVQSALSTSLSDFKVTRDDLPHLAADASKQWTALFNPRPVSAEDFVALYEAVL
jgi:alcohol dehydrogenase